MQALWKDGPDTLTNLDIENPDAKLSLEQHEIFDESLGPLMPGGWKINLFWRYRVDLLCMKSWSNLLQLPISSNLFQKHPWSSIIKRLNEVKVSERLDNGEMERRRAISLIVYGRVEYIPR